MSEKTYALFAREPNKKLIAKLRDKSPSLILFPAPEVSGIEIEEDYLQKIFEFDWIIFTDIFAAEFFLRSAEKQGMDLFELDSLRICTVGEAAADRLRFVQVHSDVIPTKSFPKEVYSALSEYVFDENELKRLKFLVVSGRDSSSEIIEMLKKNEIVVTETSVYQLTFQENENLPKLKALLAGGAVDEFVFSSPEEVLFLKNLLQSDDFTEIMSDTELTASDAVTFQSILEYKR